MKHILIVALAILSSGCGFDFGYRRSARDVCRSVGATDDLINFTFTLVRADRDAGFTAYAEIIGGIGGCSGDYGGGCPTNPNVGFGYTLQECILDCSVCSTVIVEEVYP